MISANKLYQESGSSLSFKDWLEREKAKGNFIPNANALEQFNSVDGVSDNKESGTTDVSTNLVRNIAIVGVLFVIAYVVIQRKNK
jgi:hypothetical protein